SATSVRECRTLKGRCHVDGQDLCHRRATHEQRSAVTPNCGLRSWGHLEASRAASARGRVHCRRPNTRERRDRSGANAYERHDTHGEGKVDMMVGTLREDMRRDYWAVSGLFSQGCSGETRPVPVGTARPSQRRRSDADRWGLTPYAAGAVLSTESALSALTSAFDLTVYPVNLCEHVFRPGLHLQVG